MIALARGSAEYRGLTHGINLLLFGRGVSLPHPGSIWASTRETLFKLKIKNSDCYHVLQRGHGLLTDMLLFAVEQGHEPTGAQVFID